MLATTSYDAWGVPQTGSPAPFGFTGELHSGGLVYLRARWYAAGAGVFTGRDPLGELGGLNLYTYASNDPINRVDALGLKDFRYGTEQDRTNNYEQLYARLMAENPIAPGWASIEKSGNEDRYEKAMNTYLMAFTASGAFPPSAAYPPPVTWPLLALAPNAKRLMQHYIEASGETVSINIEDLALAAPRSMEKALDLEFNAVGDFVQRFNPGEGQHFIVSSDASKRIRGQEGTDPNNPGYPTIFPIGASMRAKESLDWFLAVNDFTIWGDGTLTVYCGDAGTLYSIILDIRFFDLYDWEPNPGEPPDTGVDFAPDRDLRELYLFGLAQYFYVKDTGPYATIRDYVRIGTRDSTAWVRVK